MRERDLQSGSGGAAPAPLVVLCGASLWEGPRLADRPLAEHLSEHATVLYVEPPISRRRAAHDGRATSHPELRRVGSGLFVLGPVVLPAKDRPIVDRLTVALMRRAIARAVGRLELPVVAMIISAPHRDLFGAAGEGRAVYWVKDDYVAGAHLLDLSEKRLRRAIASRTARADDIVVVSPGLLASFRAAGHDPVLIPNGVDPAPFDSVTVSVPPGEIELPRPIVGYLGGISDRLDPSLLTRLADQGHSLLLVGPQNRSADWPTFRELFARANVQWLGTRPIETLPAYLSIMDVGIVPYRVDEFNRASFPLKSLEYLAAGKQVVATDLPAMRWLGTECVRLAGDAASFAATVDEALSVAGQPEIAAACRSVAAANTWTDRARRFAEVIGM